MDQAYIKAKLANLPHAPGSYQMKDKKGEIIYVGKAKNLFNRVNQYFVGAHDFKTTKMVSMIEDFDFIVTKSEKEALVLEINLIKKYRPKYNIMFIDDSTYPYIKITNEKYPRMVIARDLKKDRKAKYFGPFPDVTAARTTLKVLQSIYPFRLCKTMPKKVCLYYHMKQCYGPCEFQIDSSVYTNMVEGVTRFLNGDTKEVEDDLKQKMIQASENLEFEKANEYKFMIDSIHQVIDKQVIESAQKGSRDVFAYYFDRGYLAIQGFLVRNGVILNKEIRLQPCYDDIHEEFTSFLYQYYQDHPTVSELVLPSDFDFSVLSEVLDTTIVQPQKRYRRSLIEMCIDNAKKQLDLKFETVKKQESFIQVALNQLYEVVKRPIPRIELFDNSHISGQFTVAACVSYDEGIPDKKNYRLYRLHTGNSDIDSMKEVIYRRYFRLLKEGKNFPDAIIVDGGMIQMNAAKEILDSLGIEILILGLVKDDHHTTRALLDMNGSEFPIDKHSSLFFLLTQMQDEVHRVAIGYHRKLRSKAQTKSILDEIDGIGEQRKKLLLKRFSGLKGLKNATIDQISEVIPRNVAEKVYFTLHTDGL